MKKTIEHTARVYHATRRDKVGGILNEGLMPLATNRPRELAMVDVAFDKVATNLAVPWRRAGIFAWPDRKPPIFGDSVILEVIVDPKKVPVLHTAYVDLSWGMVERVLNRVRPAYREKVDALSPQEALEFLGDAQIYEGRLRDVLAKLAEYYWKSSVLLSAYSDQNALALNLTVNSLQMTRFVGLLPNLDHEVALGMDTIEPTRIRPLGFLRSV
ncbi:hypothetical protein HY990_06355 [Candidatus Micrarchaeota archaeon]|nr:hypothetical protein [Candidatus Micrarchaeota archaeon]